VVNELADLARENILSLGMQADDARRKTVGSRVYYQRVHIVHVSDLQNGFTVPEPASELRVLDTPDSFQDALSALRAAKAGAGARPLTAFSLAAVEQRARDGWGELSRVLTEFAAAGMIDFAEIPADLLHDLDTCVVIARASGLLAQRLTTAHPLGDQKVQVLERIARCHAKVGGITRVSPLSCNVPHDKPTTGYEDVRTVALARLAVSVLGSTATPFVEVDWTLYGPKLAQVALTFGADFLDAVSATTDDALGRRRATVEDVERNIRAAGYEPQEFRPPLDMLGAPGAGRVTSG
jgi:aminodeoxyfutalosine synthase